MKKVIEAIEKEKIIAIVRGVSKEKLVPLAQAMYEGGIRLVECTFDASGKMSDSENAENIKMLAEHFEGKMLVGAGTVLTKEQVELTQKAGGRFIISPDTNPEVIRKTKELGLVSIPGALTPTEAVTAHSAGADFVKLFPITSMGSRYIKDLKAPLSNIKFLAVGGIDEKNMNEYFEAGASGIGIGSGIINKKMIENNDFEGITSLAKAYTENI